jgi:AraC family transcriptional regulator
MVQKLSPGQYYGQARGHREVAGLTFSESVYAPNFFIPAHRHEHAFFYLVVEGHCTEVCRSDSQTGGPATLVFHPPGEVHANRWPGPGGRCFHIELAPTRLESVLRHAPDLDRTIRLSCGLPNWLALRLYREYLRGDGASPLALEGLALELLAESSRHALIPLHCEPPRWLLRVRDLLHSRFPDDLPLVALAAEGGVHPAHLARAFRKHFGRTVGDYVRRLRVEDACLQLATSDAPLVTIALDCGFADKSHFAKTFRLQMGMTPGEFRRSVRSRKSGTT